MRGFTWRNAVVRVFAKHGLQPEVAVGRRYIHIRYGDFYYRVPLMSRNQLIPVVEHLARSIKAYTG